MMLSSCEHSLDLDDSVSTITIESSHCHGERNQFEHQMSELRLVNASLRNTVTRLSSALQEKEETILDMQEAHESKMLDMLKTKLSNTSVSAPATVSCTCRCVFPSTTSQGNNHNFSASDQQDVSKASEKTEAKVGKGRNGTSKKMSWCKIKTGMSCSGRSVLSKINIRASLSLWSVPKVVVASFCDTSDDENMSSLTS
eukprot:scaffold5745_cov96-Skeletonema_dohrnii-CCMP3373.AAC.7